jgi:hypothetical protein
VWVEGTASQALGSSRIEVVARSQACHTFISVIAFNASLQALGAQVAASLVGIVLIRFALHAVILKGTLHAGRKLI